MRMAAISLGIFLLISVWASAAQWPTKTGKECLQAVQFALEESQPEYSLVASENKLTHEVTPVVIKNDGKKMTVVTATGSVQVENKSCHTESKNSWDLVANMISETHDKIEQEKWELNEDIKSLKFDIKDCAKQKDSRCQKEAEDDLKNLLVEFKILQKHDSEMLKNCSTSGFEKISAQANSIVKGGKGSDSSESVEGRR